MKILFVRVLFGFVLFFSSGNFLSAAPRGVVFYRPFQGAGDSVTSVTEYTELKKHSLVVNFFPYGQSREKRVRIDCYLGSVEYVDLKKGSILNAKQYQSLNHTIAALKKSLDLYPNAKKVIGHKIVEFERAREMILQENVLINGVWKKIPKVDLWVGKEYYRDARLLNFRNGRALIRYGKKEEGSILLSSLTDENIELLNSTSFSEKIFRKIPLHMLDYSNGIFRSEKVRSIMLPLVRSAGVSPKNSWGRGVRAEVGESAKGAIKLLKALASTLPEKEAKQIQILAEEIYFPFQMAAERLSGKADAERKYQKALKDLQYIQTNRFKGGDHQIRVENAMRSVTNAKAERNVFDAVRKDQLANDLQLINQRIAGHLKYSNLEVAQAHAVCLYSLRDYQNLKLPFQPVVSRIWTTMSSLDEASRKKVQEEATSRIVTAVAVNWGAEGFKTDGEKRMLRSFASDDFFGQFFEGLIEREISRGVQNAAIGEIEANLEIIFYERGAEVRRLKDVLFYILKANSPDEVILRAAVVEGMRRNYPIGVDDAEMVSAIFRILKLAQEFRNG